MSDLPLVDQLYLKDFHPVIVESIQNQNYIKSKSIFCLTI
jgi:hypothetical protein